MSESGDRLLRLAAERVAEDWSALRVEAASREEAGRQIELVIEAIERRRAGHPDLPPDLTPSPLGRRVAVLIRREYLRLVTDEAPAESLLASLTAIESVAAGLEPSWDARFADLLSGPQALELIVEVAHDLRSPLTSILFLAETLKRGRSGPITPLQERQLGLIYSAAFGLSSVASDVIELVRGGERLFGSEVMPFSIAEITESVRDIVLPIVEEKGLEIRVAHHDLGTRTGQPVALSRILLNLTTNALKFTDTGYVELAATRVSSTGVEFAVTDTGRGIPADALAMLFEPFRRRRRAGEYAFSGSGLGLSICRRLIEAMGGELAVRTSAGRGTRFSFVLDLPLAGDPSGFPEITQSVT